MAPIHSALAQILPRADAATPGPEADPASNISEAGAWSGSFTVASVDLIAMIVSDAGLSSSTPEWWNCSPIGCILIGIQPRGGWQVLQRSVQWGDDYLSRAFGIKSDATDLYKFFACSVRNRLEVWNSNDFISPTKKPNYTPRRSRGEIVVGWAEASLKGLAWWCRQLTVRTKSQPAKTVPALDSLPDMAEHQPGPAPAPVPTSAPASAPAPAPTPAVVPPVRAKPDPDEDNPEVVREWLRNLHDDDGQKPFEMHRPTKLLEGSKGGPAFMCSLLKPRQNDTYSIATQARMQMLSVLLVAAGLTRRDSGEEPGARFRRVLEKDLEMSFRYSCIFNHLLVGLAVADLLLLSYIIFSAYCLFQHNYFHDGAPYALQLASLSSWSVGAIGLLSLGGNPRVKISSSVLNIPRHVLEQLYTIPEGFFNRPNLTEEASLDLALEQLPKKHVDEDKDILLEFGYLQSTHYASSHDTCTIPFEEAKMICGLVMKQDRRCQWYWAFFWFVLHLLFSICLQIFMSSVATLGSQVLGVLILILTSLLRGAGIAGPEAWMIPGFKMRKGAHYGANLLSKTESR